MGKLGAIFCALWCLIAGFIVVERTHRGGAFDTDIQGFLPKNTIDPIIRASMTEAGGAAASRFAVVVSAPQPDRARAAAADLQAKLIAAKVFTTDAADGEQMARWLFANRNALSCETSPDRFNGDVAAKRSLAMIYAPTAPISGEMLARDPFVLTLQLADCLTPAFGGALGEASLVSGRLANSAFRIDVQDSVVEIYGAWKKRWPDVQSARAGAVFYAEEGARQARDEISLISTISLVAIVLCLIVCFRRIESIVGTLTVTAVGALGSMAATMVFFPQVHVLVLVFGSALIGITSDYALLYLSTGPQSRWAPAHERLASVFRPLLTCASATALGFASLGLFGVGLFDQVAVFSVAGIATAWLFTVTIQPLMDLRARDPQKMAVWWEKLEAPFLRIHWTRTTALIGAAVFVAFTVVGVARFRVLDDVRQFQPRSPVLMAEEAKVREAVGFSASPRFLLSYGKSPEEARQREEATLATLPEPVVRDILATSRFDPSTARRAANEEALRTKLFEPHLAERVALLGVTDPDPLAKAPAKTPDAIAALSGRAGDLFYLIAPLGPYAAAQLGEGGPNTQIIDPAGRYTRAFARLRVFASSAFAAALGACAVIIMLIFRSWRSLAILASPAIGAVMAILIPSAFGVPTSFFSVVAMFVVMGAGIDHAVFQFEMSETGRPPMQLGVFLAAVTTILSMGLLGLSGTYPVQSFGLSVAAGVTTAYMFSFIPGRMGGGAKR